MSARRRPGLHHHCFTVFAFDLLRSSWSEAAIPLSKSQISISAGCATARETCDDLFSSWLGVLRVPALCRHQRHGESLSHFPTRRHLQSEKDADSEVLAKLKLERRLHSVALPASLSVQLLGFPKLYLYLIHSGRHLLSVIT